MNRTAAGIDLNSHRISLARRIFSAACLAIVFSAHPCQWAVGQTIANASFETPDLLPDTLVYSPTDAGWEFGFNARIRSYSDPPTDQPTGDQVAQLAGATQIQQTVTGFTVGQAYRLDWFQGYGFGYASGGSAVAVQLHEPGGGTIHTIAPLELSNSQVLAARSSDVFIAESESYELVVLGSDEVPDPFSRRDSLLDEFRFVAVDEPATARSSISTSLELTSASNLEVDVVLSGQSLNSNIASLLDGNLNIDFDFVNGEVSNLHINVSQLAMEPEVSGVLQLGSLGSATASFQNSLINLFHAESDVLGQHRVSVDENGEFLLGGIFATYSGEGELEFEGPISTLIGEDAVMFDVGDIPASDLGNDEFRSETVITGPGTVHLSPTGNPLEYLTTIGFPLFAVGELGVNLVDLDAEVKLSGFIEAQGIVVVPEPSSFTLTLLAVAFIGLFAVHRLWRFRTSSV